MTAPVNHTLAILVGSRPGVGLDFWLVVSALALGLEAAARFTRLPVPPLSDLVARYLPTPLLRTAGVALWLFAGWHLFSH
ncbi:MAG: DUF6186 family protein [Actinomycetota bacterium]